MSLIRWGRFRGEHKPAAALGEKWLRSPRQIRKGKRTTASTLTQTGSEFVLTANLGGSGAGDVAVILEDSTLVIQADVERDEGGVVFKGTASYWFTLPGEVDARTLRMMRHRDVVTVYVEKLAIPAQEMPGPALA
jgi:HSP20 family molecular chaperone IbpA